MLIYCKKVSELNVFLLWMVGAFCTASFRFAVLS